MLTSPDRLRRAITKQNLSSLPLHTSLSLVCTAKPEATHSPVSFFDECPMPALSGRNPEVQVEEERLVVSIDCIYWLYLLPSAERCHIPPCPREHTQKPRLLT